MSHVDEGVLHALLDGALAAAQPAEAERVELHLAACPDCRARLDDAARLREQAGALLASARPRAVATPPFDVIRARAAGSTGAPQRATARARRSALLATPFSGFAWAATVVLAVGLGWLLHDTVEEPERIALSDAAESASAADTDVHGTAQDPVALEEALATQNADGARSAEPPSSPGEPVARRPAEVIVEGAPQGFQSISPAPPPPSAAPASRIAEYDVATESAIGAGAAGVAADAASAGAPAPTRSAEAGWSAVTLQSAARVPGGLVRIEGAELVEAATRRTVAGVEVRTVQMTDRGETLTLVQRPRTAEAARRLESAESERRRQAQQADAAGRDASAAAEAPSLERVVPAVSVQIDDWVVTISGAVAPERLEQLAGELH